MTTIKHSGAIGDLIYALPYIESLGNIDKFYVGEHTFVRGIPDSFTPAGTYGVINSMWPNAANLTDPTYTNYAALKRILEVQPYISEVISWNGETVDHDIDEFRRSWTDSKSIIENVNDHFGWKGWQRDTSFLFNIPTDSQWFDTCCCARSPRAVGLDGHIRYKHMIEKLEAQVKRFVFIGIEKEYNWFRDNIYSNIDYVKCVDMYDAAVIINSCKFGIYNSSGPLAIAAGLNKLRYVENPMSHIINVIYLNSINERYF